MKPVRILLVDDEILAIEHIRQLVDWDALGCEIAAAATRPKQALELASRHEPDLAIIDIVMPGMDGLALSKQLLAQHPRLKIVLLTAYKEFEYAKEAVQLGVSNYWVKHELDAVALTQGLHNLRKQIETERNQLEDTRTRILAEWLEGRPVTDEQWSTVMRGRSGHDRMHLLVLKPDRPFPLLGGWIEDTPNDDAPVPEPQSWENLFGPELLFAAPLRDRISVLVFGDSAARGASKMREMLEEKTLAARERLEKTVSSTVSAVLAAGLANRGDVRERVREAVRLLLHSVFYGSRHTFRLNDLPPRNEAPEPLHWEEPIARIREKAAEGLYPEATREIADLFAAAEKARDLAGFSDMCRQLAGLINRSRAHVQLPSLRETAERGRLSTESWTSCRGLRDWFVSELEAIESAGRDPSPHSRKVRQAIEFMEKHYADAGLGADAIARHLGISRDHLRHVFKEATGRTVLDRLIDIRMEQAKRMLAEGKLKIYEIAERSGYRNGQYFSQVFRKATGMNPVEYMEKPR